jgi:signal transduction histidine kinase
VFGLYFIIFTSSINYLDSMRHLILPFLICIIGLSIKAGEIDSLIRSLPALTDKYEKAAALNALCLKLVYIDPDSSLVFGKKALAIGKAEKDNLIIGKSFNRIGIVYDVKNSWDTALMFYDSALLFSNLARDSITIASAYNNIGLVFWNKSHYDKAVWNFFKSLKLFEKLGRKRGVANTYNNIGLILMEQDRDSAALRYQFSGLEIREEIKDEYGINDSWLNIALLYWDLQKHDSSIFYYWKAIPFFLKKGNHYALGTAYNGLAMNYEGLMQWDSALYYYDKAFAGHLKVQNNYKAASTLLNKSCTYRLMGDQDKELETLLKAKDLVSKESSGRVRSKILFQLGKLYDNKGMYKKASKLLIEHKYINDSLYNVDRDEKIEQIKVRYETEKKEKELLEQKAQSESLAKENALAEIKLYNRNIWILAIVAASLLLIFLLLFVVQHNQRKARAEKDAAIIAERENGMKAIFDAQEEERKRIAKDLHDGIGQQLSAIKMFFQSLSGRFSKDKPELMEETEKIEKMITEAATDVRIISHQMMPRALTELGLVDALEDMIDKCFSKSDVKCSFEHHNMAERLPQHVEIGLYRIAQELLNNIIKHSHAVKVDVQLMRMQNFCLLIVQDNGQGINEADQSGQGMLNINNRLRALNGEMNMESFSGKGTTATIRVSLETEN